MISTAELQNCGTAELNGDDNMSAQLRNRTKKFAVRIVEMFEALPKKASAYVLGKQVLRSGTSVAANYRSSCRARIKAEFLAKIGVVSEEADECVFWLELLVETGIVNERRMKSLLKEARELSAIFTASYNTARGSDNSAAPQFRNYAITDGSR
jgi:four helix bundle protein